MISPYITYNLANSIRNINLITIRYNNSRAIPFHFVELLAQPPIKRTLYTIPN